jgi:hypothetical protein
MGLEKEDKPCLSIVAERENYQDPIWDEIRSLTTLISFLTQKY